MTFDILFLKKLTLDIDIQGAELNTKNSIRAA